MRHIELEQEEEEFRERKKAFKKREQELC
jgi:hypothetical protein